MLFMRPKSLMVALGMSVALIGFSATISTAATGADWNPRASERLVKLPMNYLEKHVQRDFASSTLGSAMATSRSELAGKKKSIKELMDTLAVTSDGNMEVEVRHQILAEKQGYIRLLGDRLDMRKQQIETRTKLYKRLLKKMDRKKASETPEAMALIEQQEAAQRRFASSIAKVDLAVFGAPSAKESKYNKQYSKNVNAINKLLEQVSTHSMNQEPEMDGKLMSKREYLSKLIQDGESELALIDQENTILSYMAKLVALDAMELAEEVGGVNGTPTMAEEEVTAEAAVDLFLED